MSGRHAAPVGRNFYRDLATMLGGIIVVAILVYGLLWFFAGRDNVPPPTSQAAQPTTTTAAVTTTRQLVSNSTSTTEVPTTTAVTLRAPEEVRVLVLNAVGVTGLAADVTEDLQGFGYQVLTPSNYQPALEQSRVWYWPAFEAEAFELAGVAFPDALVELNNELTTDADIVVILGASFER
ncbi:MAG TPA: LytR C-terminal domain-containing protein [Acidimicrobiia bacterium]|nr:LytR C-terminal domain-containing protein [Acidimicrobiia bacterium]